MDHMDMDLRKYLKQNHNLTWKERIKITVDIVDSLLRIHKENEIHRDLHSGNILYSKYYNNWYISDLGFCGPADKPLNIVYGNLPYMAPEVISGKEYTYASDIYSTAIIMWEISSGQPPFINYEHDYYLAMDIINGMRPKIVPETPSEYKKLMKQCWNANPLERPNIDMLWDEIIKLNKYYYQNMTDRSSNSKSTNMLDVRNIINRSSRFSRLSGGSTSILNTDTSRLFHTSKLHSFDILPEPRNATEGILANLFESL